MKFREFQAILLNEMLPKKQKRETNQYCPNELLLKRTETNQLYYIVNFI